MIQTTASYLHPGTTCHRCWRRHVAEWITATTAVNKALGPSTTRMTLLTPRTSVHVHKTEILTNKKRTERGWKQSARQRQPHQLVSTKRTCTSAHIDIFTMHREGGWVQQTVQSCSSMVSSAIREVGRQPTDCCHHLWHHRSAAGTLPHTAPCQSPLEWALSLCRAPVLSCAVQTYTPKMRLYSTQWRPRTMTMMATR